MSFSVRWSMHEARKAYARPFGVSFLGGDGEAVLSIAVNGPELLYYRQFQGAVLALAGELFRDKEVEDATFPQLRWLDGLALLIPEAEVAALVPTSTFTEESGRSFRYAVAGDGWEWSDLDGSVLLEYQEFQAALAHQSGRLYRNPRVETIENDVVRQRAWLAELAGMLERPGEGERLAADWPWR